MPGQGAEIRTGHMQQLGFDSLAAGSSLDGGAAPSGIQDGIAFGTVVRRAASRNRWKAKKPVPLPERIQQATLEELFAQPTQTREDEPVVRRKIDERQSANGKV